MGLVATLGRWLRTTRATSRRSRAKLRAWSASVGRALSALGRPAVRFARRFDPWLRFALTPIVRLAGAIRALVVWTFAKLVSLLRWLFVPKGETPFDVLKHYVSVVLAFIGLMALLWAGKQIASPPIVITVTKLPAQFEKENWINPEISRALIDQIERMRAVVKDERIPTFQAVLNPPNIVLKSDQFSLNIQEQILTPLSSLLGRTGDVHLTVTCLHPGCVRTSDADCQTPVPVAAGQEPQGKNFLCLRLTADVRRGALHRRVTPRLVLSNSTYDADTTRQMAKVAEAVASVADPATAALYYYRRLKQEGAAARSFSNDPNLLAELRGEAFSAAEQADAQDAVSACWAHSVRAHIAIDRRELSLAETFIARAGAIPWWRHLLQGKNPLDCLRLTVAAEIALTRALARRDALETYPPHPDDVGRKRRLQANRRVAAVVANLGGGESPSWRGRLLRPFLGEEQVEAAEFARAEVGLNWFTNSDKCILVRDGSIVGASDADDVLASDFEAQEDGEDAEEYDELLQSANIERPLAWQAIQASIRKISKQSTGLRFSPLVRQAALEFLERLSAGVGCLSEMRPVVERLYVNHPEHPGIARLLANQLVAHVVKERDNKAGSDEGEEEKDEEARQTSLKRAISLYERLVDIADEKVDVFALGQLALINTASARFPARDEGLNGPPDSVMRHVKRAWQRFEQQLYPTDIRHHAEIMLVHWGSLLLAYYPQTVVDADLSLPTTNQKISDAAAQNADFQRALRILFPGMQWTKLSALPQLRNIGPRIGCLCLLIRMAARRDDARFFFLSRASEWQRSTRGFRTTGTCSRDLLPPDPGTFEEMQEGLDDAEKALADSTVALERNATENRKAAHRDAQEELAKAKKNHAEWASARLAYDEQIEKLRNAKRLCHVR
jgi:hypothetical protein